MICDTLPRPDRDAGSFRMLELLKMFVEIGHRTTLITHDEELEPDYAALVKSFGIEVHSGPEAAVRHLADKGIMYDRVLLSRPEVAFRYAFSVRAYAPHAQLVYDTVDLHWVRARRGAKVTGDLEMMRAAERFKRIELFNAMHADMVITVTASEKELLLAENPELSVEVVPIIHPVAQESPGFGPRNGLLFVGGFWHAPNEDAVRYFVSDVWPLVRAVLPDVELFIAGSNSSTSIGKLATPSVHVLGHVPDLVPYFARAKVFVAPLRYGAGLKGKVAQSMSHGLPVVTTSTGAEGMGLVNEQHALIADTADAFARAVVQLYTDAPLWQRISNEAKSHVARHFSPAAVREQLVRVLPAGPRQVDAGGVA